MKAILWRITRIIVWLAGAMFAILLFIYGYVEMSVQEQCSDNIENISGGALAVVLGTSERVVGGADNPYFWRRMEAAAALYHADKVDSILVSGDNSTRYYDEPQAMRTALHKLGVPDSVILSDGGGVRTFASVVRCKTRFHARNVIFISQNFHVRRAVFIANHISLQATGYIAEDAGFIRGIPLQVRELFARAVACADIVYYNIST
jgi:SanA protein